MTTAPIKRASDLPNFIHPPVVETVLSLQFEPVPDLHAAHLGLLWSKYRAEFPFTEERPPFDQAFEQFPENPAAPFGLQLRVLENPPIPRIWFITETGNELIQVQLDRFLKNWRKESTGEPYPRYEPVKASFERDFLLLQDFLHENGFPPPRITQCEVTYMNHIVAGEGWERFSDVDQIFAFWNKIDGSVPGCPEDLRAHLRYIIPSQDGSSVGRLHADIHPAFRATDGRPMYVFQLTARGQLGSDFAFFDLGREWIVKTFAQLTTPHMHAIWKRTDNNANS